MKGGDENEALFRLKNFLDLETVTVSFVFHNYYSITD